MLFRWFANRGIYTDPILDCGDFADKIAGKVDNMGADVPHRA